jgi:hypothetical protein
MNMKRKNMKRKTILKGAGVLVLSAVLLFSSTTVIANKTNQTPIMSSPEKTYVAMNWTLKGGFGFTASMTNVGTTTSTNLSWYYEIINIKGLVLNGKTKSATNLTLAPGKTITIKGFPIGIAFADFDIWSKDSEGIHGGVGSRFIIIGPLIFSSIHIP